MSAPSPSSPPQESPLTATRRGVDSARKQAAVGGQAVLVRGGERVLGRQTVVRHDDPRLELLGEHRPVEVVVVERARHRPPPWQWKTTRSRRGLLSSSYQAQRTPPSTASLTVTYGGTGWPWKGAIIARTAR